MSLRHARRVLALIPSCLLSCLAFVALACSGDAADAPPPSPSPLPPPTTTAIAHAGSPTLRAGVTRAGVTVDAFGQAQVSLPLALPQAGNGLAPTLALAYYSGNEAFGPLGHGWSVAPLSSIRRCPASAHVDGRDAGLALDDGDRACLDGQRLVAVSGTYFADGSSYRLQRDDATLVRLARAGASDPGTWTAYRKSGEILRFGASAASRHMHAGGQAIEWKIDELRDRSDNVVRFVYEHDAGERDVRLSAIDYGGNDAAPLAPYRRVELRYAGAASPTTSYLAGQALVRGKRLDRVDMLSDGAPVWSYRLTYQPLGSGAGEQLAAVQQCFRDGSCYPETRFDYSDGALALATDRKASVTYRPADADLRSLTLRRLVDVDRDGWDDVVTLNRAEIAVERSDRSGGYEAAVVRPAGLPRTWSSRQSPALFYDLDADGYVDVVTTVTRTLAGQVTSEQTGLYMLRGGADGFSPAVQVSRELGEGTEAPRLYLTMADADRDGRPELFAFTDAGVRLFTLRNGRLENAGAAPIAAPYFGLAQGFRFSSHPREVADVNGDGFPDLVGFGEHAVEVSLGHGFTFDPPAPWTTELTAQDGAESFGIENHIRLLADANADGLPDLVGFHEAGVLVALNTGRGFAPSALWLDDLGVAQGWTSASQLRTAADVNGDGWLDFVGVSPSRVRVVLGRGAALPPVATLAPGRLVELATSSAGFKQWKRALYQLDFADVDSDGMADLVCFLPEGLWALANRTHRLRLTAVTDGYGKRTELTYATGNTAAVYRRSRDLAYPLVTLPSVGLLVRALTERDAPGAAPHTMTYRYENGVIDRAGLGFLGFETWTTSDAAAETERVVRYSLDAAGGTAGLPVADEVVHVTAAGRTPLSRTETTWESRVLPGSPAHRFTFAKLTTTTGFDEAGASLSRTVLSQRFDERQHLVFASTTVTDAFGSQTVTTEQRFDEDDPSRWLVGRVTSSKVTSSRPGRPDVVRTTRFHHDGAGRLVEQVRDPGTPFQERITNDYTNNPFGFIGSTTREFTPEGAAGLPASHTVASATYDARGYLRTSTGVLGFSEAILERDPSSGNVLTVRDASGRLSRFRYDVDGGLIEITRPDGSRTRITRRRCAADCPAGAVVRTTSERDGAAAASSYEDASGRELRHERRVPGGALVHRDRAYTFDGQLARESVPYFAGAAPAGVRWTAYRYDGLRRLVEVTRPDGTTERLERAGASSTTVDARGHRTTRVVDAQGLDRVLTDARGGQLRYEYDAANRLTAVIDPAGRRTEMTYDLLGRRTRLVDPTLGTSRTVYNALGLAVESVDGKGQVTRLRYDLSGRLVEARAGAGTPDEEVSRWRYDTAAHGIGQLAAAENGSVARAFEYDALGRSTATTVTLDGRHYRFEQAYDALGRPSVVTYPSGLAVENVYDAHGFHRATRNAATGRTYYTVEDHDAWGQARRIRHGNGLVTTLDLDPAGPRLLGTRTARADGSDVVRQTYAYDAAGNLSARTDGVTGVAETFAHDELDRLVRAARAGAAPVTVGYDALGNIAQRSDVGPYTYGEACDGVSPGPFAVSSAGGRSYCYDGQGQMVRGNGRTLRYGPSGLPVRIASADAGVELRYGPTGERVLQIERRGGGVTTVRTPSAGFEDVSGPGGDETRTYLAGGVVIVRSARGEAELYSHVDHLGSTTAITDGQGNLVERYSYDPWGRRTGTLGAGAAATPFGFTGHEHLDAVGLVHMGGRVYDPELGRFVSPDPFVQDQADTQSLNRYSYVQNNPLSSTDPSGFLSMKSIGRSIGKALGGLGKGLANPGRALAGAGGRLNKWVSNPQNQRMVAAIAISVVAAYYAPIAAAQFSGWAQWAAGAAVSGAGGFASGYVASDGNLDYARRSALTSMAFFAIGQSYMGQELTAGDMATKAIAHGVVGGASSAANGGSFESGFWSSTVSEGFSLAGGYQAGANALGISARSATYAAVSAALVGGTVSELVGGRFEDAALSSALGSLFNEYFHRFVTEADGSVVSQVVHRNDGNPDEPCFIDYETILRSELVFEAGLDGDGRLALKVGAALVAPYLATRLIAATETLTLYRVVGAAEAEIIAATGRVPPTLSGMPKYFSRTAEGAASYAKQAHTAWGDVSTMITTRIRASRVTPEMLGTVDVNVPALVVPTEQLGLLGPARVMNHMPVPRMWGPR